MTSGWIETIPSGRENQEDRKEKTKIKMTRSEQKKEQTSCPASPNTQARFIRADALTGKTSNEAASEAMYGDKDLKQAEPPAEES